MTSLHRPCMGKQAKRTTCGLTSDGANDVNRLLHTAAPMDVKCSKACTFLRENCIQDPGYELCIKTQNARTTSCPLQLAKLSAMVQSPTRPKATFRQKSLYSLNRILISWVLDRVSWSRPACKVTLCWALEANCICLKISNCGIGFRKPQESWVPSVIPLQW